MLAGAALLAGCRTSPPAAPRAAPGSAYLTTAEQDNRRLDRDFDRLHGRDRSRLAAARADLRDIAATERAFDRQLARLTLPSPAGATARALITANQARAALTDLAAASTTLGRLHTYDQPLAAANARVETPVRALRSQLGLPPPATD